MKTGIITRSAAVLTAWAGIAGIATAQELSSTASDANAMALAATTSIPSSVTLKATDVSEVDATVDQWMETVDAIRTSLADNDGFIRNDEKAVLSFLFKPGAVADTLNAGLDAKVEALWNEIVRLAPNVSPVRGEEADEMVRAAVVRRVIQGAPGAKVLRAIVTGNEWTVRMTDAGLPKSEARKGFVLYRLPNVDLVVCQQIVIERQLFATSVNDHKVKLGYLRMQTRP